MLPSCWDTDLSAVPPCPAFHVVTCAGFAAVKGAEVGAGAEPGGGMEEVGAGLAEVGAGLAETAAVLACTALAASLAFAAPATEPGLPSPVKYKTADTTGNATTAYSAIRTQGCLRGQWAWRADLDMRDPLFRTAATETRQPVRGLTCDP